MSKEERLKSFFKNINSKTEFSEWNTSMAKSVFYVEKEISQSITYDYPLMKFLSQLKFLKEHLEMEKREYDRAKRLR